ncbi:BlaI/MecI/CopY family transcriptional regulator [Clostridium boliviensis]|uniref:BlaI/MecI/CopY family transcriptional regulator n=1 Tax=Clostridium boliviensis TaxID=318465 RepID=A0ABU4GQR8_9CLOT|nr:BlaI/MecI/CopY family transcriptional regulator [Clostridium boliviensis]MDW2799273.1 BlaI/MecI/CopY family transcriptional regulator [Clostridium boliviensis]
MQGNKDINSCFFLTNKEESAMKVLWASDTPLCATEIAERIPNRIWPSSSIQSILRTLEKKEAIEVAEITKIGKSYGRLFRPTISANEYAVMQFDRYYQGHDQEGLSLISTLLGKKKCKKEIAEALQELLNQYRED